METTDMFQTGFTVLLVLALVVIYISFGDDEPNNF